MTKKLFRMLSFIKIPLFLSLLMFMGVNVSAQVEEPKPGTYFDLQVYRDSTGNVLFQAGSDSCGLLRNPNDYKDSRDERYWIFTTRELIRISEKDTAKVSGVSAVTPFDFLVLNDVYQQGKSGSKPINKQRPRGYKVVKNITRNDRGEQIFELQGSNSNETFSFFIVNAEDWNKEIKMTISSCSQTQVDTTMILCSDTIFCKRAYAIGDTLNLKLTRTTRGAFIRSVSLDGNELNGKFALGKSGGKREKDDIVYTTASLNIDSLVLGAPDNAQWILTTNVSYLKNGKLENDVFNVVIPMKASQEEGDIDKIIRWCNSHINIIIIYGGFISGVIVSIIFYFFLWEKPKKKKRQEEEKREKEEEARRKEEQNKNKKEGITPTLESDKPKIEESVGGNQEEDMEIVPESDKYFEYLTNADAAQLLKEYLTIIYGENIDKRRPEELDRKTYNSWVTKFCKEWNRQNLDNKIPESQFTIDNIFSYINKGYIKPVDKRELENELRPCGLPQDSYFILLKKYKTKQLNAGCQNAVSEYKEEVCKKLKDILSILGEQHFTVGEDLGHTVDELVNNICTSIRQGMQQDELQAKVNGLKEEIKSMTKVHEEELKNKDTERQIEQDTLKEQFQKEKQDALETKDREYKDKIKNLNEEHQKAIKDLNEAQEKEKVTLTNDIDKFKNTIIEKDNQITKLEYSLQDDCLYFIGEFCKQIDKVGAILQQLVESTSVMSGNDSKCANIVKKAQGSFVKFSEQVKQSNNKEHWLSGTVKLSEVIADLQNFIEMGLRSTGWVNIVSYLHLYAGATAQLNEMFNEEGLYTYQLNSLFYDVVKLLGLCGVKIVLPNLLVEKYNDEYFDYENADQWIQIFSPDLRPLDYASKIFDMSRMGYQIDGKDEVKAKVYFLEK